MITYQKIEKCGKIKYVICKNGIYFGLTPAQVDEMYGILTILMIENIKNESKEGLENGTVQL